MIPTAQINFSHQARKITGYASVFKVTDQHNDVVFPGAFTKTLKAWRAFGKWPPLLWQHHTKSPIGVWTRLYEDDIGLYGEGRLTYGVRRADEALCLLQEGAVDHLSIGFRTLKATRDEKTQARVLLDVDLIEISLVTFGANSRARATLKKVSQDLYCPPDQQLADRRKGSKRAVRKR